MIPIATTRIEVLRDQTGGWVDPQDPPNEPTVIESNIRAVIGSPAGSEQNQTREGVQFRLNADPCDITHTDMVRDSEGETYRVLWVRRRKRPIDHMVGDLVQVTGGVRSG